MTSRIRVYKSCSFCWLLSWRPVVGLQQTTRGQRSTHSRADALRGFPVWLDNSSFSRHLLIDRMSQRQTTLEISVTTTLNFVTKNTAESHNALRKFFLLLLQNRPTLTLIVLMVDSSCNSIAVLTYTAPYPFHSHTCNYSNCISNTLYFKLWRVQSQPII